MTMFEVLADPIRMKIVELLAERDLAAGNIAGRFPVSRPAVSRHLRVLRQSRLVRSRGVAQKRVYTLNPDALDQVDRWVEQCRRVWNKRLDALGRHLDSIAAADKAKGAKK
ncbi:MAG TPA: metalloregulator ArsR/SmtB family transcription factor [Candidatus Binataceae bacterium]|nr:metalloregulator ArsR/SmtB family transcription factor [Candidatus Binataceae bacterium]